MNEVGYIGLNPPSRILRRPIVLQGKKVDPFSDGITQTDSSLTLKPNNGQGICFCLEDLRAPCHPETLEAFDSTFGRMLRIHMENGAQVVLVEHLISALTLLGIKDVDIVLEDACHGPLTSHIFGNETYWVPIMGPGVSGFVNTLGPYCEDTHTSPRVLSVSRRTQYSVQEVYKRGFVERSVTIEPADRLIIQVDSARQPDIQNNPESHAMSIQEGEDLSPYLQARPIMRLDKKWKEWVLFILNLRSFALTRETYFRSRKGMSREEVVKRMYPIFQPGQNEHLYHTAIADFPGELATFLQGQHLRAKITLSDTNHLFRVAGLRALLTPEILCK